MIRRCYFLMLAGFFTSTALWAIAQPADDAQRQLKKLRSHPEQLARLHENLNAFLALPKERQAALTKLQRDLEDPKDKRLLAALERYADWLEQVRQQDPQVYQAIKEAPNPAARLALIKERRDGEWMSQQPKALREQWNALKGNDRTKFVANLHQESRQKHEQWVIAQRFWKELENKQPLPSRLADFSPRVKEYVSEYLMPSLTEDQKKKLAATEGQWPDYPVALVKIASKRPSALPPDKPHKFSQLPLPVQDRLVHKKGDKIGIQPKLLKEIRSHEGPSFASKVVAIGLRENKLPFAFEYLAPNYKSLEKPMQEFVDKKLLPLIDTPENQADNRKLTDSAGNWPEYPLMIQELSRKHNLQPPWHILPEPDRWKWDQYRDVKARSWGADVAKEKKPL